MDSSIASVQKPSASAADKDGALVEQSTAASQRVLNTERNVEKLDRASFEKLLERESKSTSLSGNRTLEISFDDDTDKVIVRVKGDDGEVVRQIPSEEYLNFAAKLQELIGVIFDETA